MPIAVTGLNWRIHQQVEDWPTSKDCVFLAAATKRLGHVRFYDWMEEEAGWANYQSPPYLPAPEAAFNGDAPIRERHDEFASVVRSYLSPAAFEVQRLARQIEAQVLDRQIPDPDLQDQIRAADVRAYLQEDREDPITRAHWAEVWWTFLEIKSRLEGATQRLPFVAGELVAMAQDGRLKTFARPKGGGQIIALTPDHWAIDPDLGLQRLASCTINPERFLDPEAPHTHWIFVGKADLGREMQAYDEERERDLEASRQPLPSLVEGTLNDCATWLILQFGDPGRHSTTKDEFFTDAKRRFGASLSERGFLRAWQAATIEYPARRTPGPRSAKARSSR